MGAFTLSAQSSSSGTSNETLPAFDTIIRNLQYSLRKCKSSNHGRKVLIPRFADEY